MHGNIYTSDDTTATPIRLVTGRNLAHARRSVHERAFVGGDLCRNHLALTSPTAKQAAQLVGVCTKYVAAAIAIADDPAKHDAVLAGQISILDAAKSADTESLAAHFARSSREEWREAARVIGPAILWDEMISPLI